MPCDRTGESEPKHWRNKNYAGSETWDPLGGDVSSPLKCTWEEHATSKNRIEKKNCASSKKLLTSMRKRGHLGRKPALPV